jgi:glyoxylase-like metal-dependent hydrolase (beta-lactamase superfamily II)
MDGVHRFAIPTPFNVGRVNCYAFVDDELTLLDPGPASADAYEELSAHLAESGYAVEEVARVVVTHPHIDHYGLARDVVDTSGATVVAHPDATDRLRDPDSVLKREQELFVRFLASMGVPKDTADTVVSLPESYREFRKPVEVDAELRDDESLDVGVKLTAVATPGHAPGSLCFLADGVAFTGDHVLDHISPNPLLTVAPDGGERTRSLPTYLRSLRKLRRHDVTVGRPGHGDDIDDFPGRIDEIVDHHQERKERIADLVADRGPVTAYELMQVLFPDLPVTETFPGISEIVGHLDLLKEESRVEAIESGGVKRYMLQDPDKQIQT